MNQATCPSQKVTSVGLRSETGHGKIFSRVTPPFEGTGRGHFVSNSGAFRTKQQMTCMQVGPQMSDATPHVRRKLDKRETLGTAKSRVFGPTRDLRPILTIFSRHILGTKVPPTLGSSESHPQKPRHWQKHDTNLVVSKTVMARPPTDRSKK